MPMYLSGIDKTCEMKPFFLARSRSIARYRDGGADSLRVDDRVRREKKREGERETERETEREKHNH